MYQLGGAFSDVEVEPGTNILVAGPPMTGKYGLALDILAAGRDSGDGSIIISTKDGYERVHSQYEEHVPDGGGPLGIVDCVTKQQGAGTTDEDLVRFVSSPVDLTGIGIELSELLRYLYQQRAVKRNRILLHSLSTLLMYSDLQTVFRFLHVFTGRVQSADALGVFIIDNSAHDTQTLSTLKQLFDGVIEVEQTDDGSRAQLMGIGEDRSWRAL